MGLMRTCSLLELSSLALLTHLLFPLLHCRLAKITSSGWSMVGIVGGELEGLVLRPGPLLVSTMACRLKQFSQMLWLVFSLEFALSFLVVFFPPPLCGFLFLPSLKQYFLKCPLIQQLHTKSLAGQSFLSLCRLLPQLLQQSVGTTTLFWSFLFMVTPVTTCWLVSRIPCEDLGGLTGHCL